jgi:hypothetical protein
MGLRLCGGHTSKGRWLQWDSGSGSRAGETAPAYSRNQNNAQSHSDPRLRSAYWKECTHSSVRQSSPRLIFAGTMQI